MKKTYGGRTRPEIPGQHVPDYMRGALHVCPQGHAWIDCGVEIEGCPVCRRGNAEVEPIEVKFKKKPKR